MSINTPLGDTVDSVLDQMLAGKSAIGVFKGFDTSGIYAKNGGDLSFYDPDAKLGTFEGKVPDHVFSRARRVFKQVARPTKLSILMAIEAYRQAGLFDQGDGAIDPHAVAVICGGHNLNNSYVLEQHRAFQDEPDFIDGLAALSSLDTDHSASVSEVLGTRGMAFTVGGACATGNIALMLGANSIAFEGRTATVVVFPVLVMDELQMQELTFLDAIAYESFADAPERASRPYDKRREGFLPCEAGAVMVLENWEHARARGASIHAELLGALSNSDANHLGNPSQDGQTRVMTDTLARYGVSPEQVDYVSAHATSTQLGDLTELRALKAALGPRMYQIFLNAPKSLMGHPGWSAGGVEGVLAVEQMKRGVFHRSCNIDDMEEEVDVDVCADGNRSAAVDLLMCNSFGMGGINSTALYRRYDGG